MKWNGEGAILASLSLLYAASARSFETGFIADPIGPKAFPVGIGILMFLVGLSLFFVKSGAPAEPLDAPAKLRALVLTGTLFAYWFLLEPLGFIASTLFAMTVLVALFRGRILHGLVFGLMGGIAIFLLFGYGLSMPLPLGRLFFGS